MNPFVTTIPETVTYSMVQRFLPQMKAAIFLLEQLVAENDANAIAADFAAAETAGGADIGTPVNYGGYDSKEMHRWMEFISAFQAFLADTVTVTFADATTEDATNNELAIRSYLPFVEA